MQITLRTSTIMIGIYVLLIILAIFFGGKSQAETLTILHTNDIHSKFEPVNQFNQTCSAESNLAGECFGGYARLATAIQLERDKALNSILVDAGDQFQGSLYFTHYQGQAVAEMMNTLGYDGMAVGNHEFDLEPKGLRRFIEQVDFPVLLSNADISKEQSLNDVLKSSAVVERDGARYGLIGLAPEDTSELSTPGPNIQFFDPVEAVRKEIAKMIKNGINRIILLSHSGYDIDKHIAANVDDIDVIVGGHTNTLLANSSDDADGPYPTWINSPDGTPTAIVHSYAYGKYLGRLKIEFDDQGMIISASGDSILVDSEYEEKQSIKERISKLSEPFDELRRRVIAETVHPIDGSKSKCRMQECEIGNLVADAMLAYMKPRDFDIAIINSGGLRSSIDQGPITMSEVMAVLPFQNRLAHFELSGADILKTLEIGVSQVADESGRFPQVSGLRYRYAPSSSLQPSRVYDVQINRKGQWMPLDPDKMYKVVSVDFLRGGGDGYSTFAQNAKNAYDFGPDVADVVIDYLKDHSPYRPVLDARIINE